MDARTTTIGRPRHDTKRLAIEKLLLEGFTPAMVRECTGSSLTVIYEVRRSLKQRGAVPLDDPGPLNAVSVGTEGPQGTPDAEGRGTAEEVGS